MSYRDHRYDEEAGKRTQIRDGEVLVQSLFLAGGPRHGYQIPARDQKRGRNTYVTMTMPLLLTHEKMTCAGVAPRRSPIVLSTGSTGPPEMQDVLARANELIGIPCTHSLAKTV